MADKRSRVDPKSRQPNAKESHSEASKMTRKCFHASLCEVDAPKTPKPSKFNVTRSWSLYRKNKNASKPKPKSVKAIPAKLRSVTNNGEHHSTAEGSRMDGKEKNGGVAADNEEEELEEGQGEYHDLRKLHQIQQRLKQEQEKNASPQQVQQHEGSEGEMAYHLVDNRSSKHCCSVAKNVTISITGLELDSANTSDDLHSTASDISSGVLSSASPVTSSPLKYCGDENASLINKVRERLLNEYCYSPSSSLNDCSVIPSEDDIGDGCNNFGLDRRGEFKLDEDNMHFGVEKENAGPLHDDNDDSN